MRLNKEQKAFSAVDPESVEFNRLQFKSPKMKTGFTVLSAFFVIGQSNYSGFGFTILK